MYEIHSRIEELEELSIKIGLQIHVNSAIKELKKNFN